MFVLVFWIGDQQFSVVEMKDIILDKSNKEPLNEGMTCPVKWRERIGRKVEEFLYNAEIKSISGTLINLFDLIFRHTVVCTSRSVQKEMKYI